MFAKKMTATSRLLLVVGVTAAVVLSPVKAPKSGSGVAPAFGSVGATYSQHCEGSIVSSTDSTTTCQGGPCSKASISTPELDFLNSSGTITITGTSVTGNALSVSLSNNSEQGLPALKDNMFINPFGITLTGTIYNGTTTGTCTNPDPNLKPPQTRCIPVGCFVIQETGSITGPPAVTFSSNSAGCYSNDHKVFDSDITFTALTIGKTTTKEPIVLHCHGESTLAF
jgi:hypothetical protein